MRWLIRFFSGAWLASTEVRLARERILLNEKRIAELRKDHDA